MSISAIFREVKLEMLIHPDYNDAHSDQNSMVLAMVRGAAAEVKYAETFQLIKFIVK